MGMAAIGIGLAAAALAGSAYSSHQQARAQDKARESQERANRLAQKQQEEANTKAEQAENKANAMTVNNYSDIKNEASNIASGLLSGGVDKNSLTLGNPDDLGSNDSFF